MSHIKIIRPSTNTGYTYNMCVDMFRQIEVMEEVEVSIAYLESRINSSSSYSSYTYTVFKYKDFYFAIFGLPTFKADSSTSTSTSYTTLYVYTENSLNSTSSDYICMINLKDYYIYLPSYSHIDICILSYGLIMKIYDGTNNDVFMIWEENGKYFYVQTSYNPSNKSSAPSSYYTPLRTVYYVATISIYDATNNNRGLILPVVWSVPSSDYKMYSSVLKQCNSNMVISTDPLSKLNINGIDYIHVCGSWLAKYTEPTSTSTSTSE